MNQNRFVVHNCVLEVCILLYWWEGKILAWTLALIPRALGVKNLNKIFCLVWLKQIRPYLYNCFKVTSCCLAAPFVWPSCTSLFYFQAAFIPQIFFHIWSTFQSFGHYWTKGWIGHLFCSRSSMLSQDRKVFCVSQMSFLEAEHECWCKQKVALLLICVSSPVLSLSFSYWRSSWAWERGDP